MKKFIKLIIIILVLACVGIGGYYVYNNFFREKEYLSYGIEVKRIGNYLFWEYDEKKQLDLIINDKKVETTENFYNFANEELDVCEYLLVDSVDPINGKKGTFKKMSKEEAMNEEIRYLTYAVEEVCSFGPSDEYFNLLYIDYNESTQEMYLFIKFRMLSDHYSCDYKLLTLTLDGDFNKNNYLGYFRRENLEYITIRAIGFNIQEDGFSQLRDESCMYGRISNVELYGYALDKKYSGAKLTPYLEIYDVIGDINYWNGEHTVYVETSYGLLQFYHCESEAGESYCIQIYEMVSKKEDAAKHLKDPAKAKLNYSFYQEFYHPFYISSYLTEQKYLYIFGEYDH